MNFDPRYRLGSVISIVRFKVDTFHSGIDHDIRDLDGLEAIFDLMEGKKEFGYGYHFHDSEIRTVVCIRIEDDDRGNGYRDKEFIFQDLDDDRLHQISYREYPDGENNVMFEHYFSDLGIDEHDDVFTFYEFESYLTEMITYLQQYYQSEPNNMSLIRPLRELCLLLVARYQKKFNQYLYVESPDATTLNFHNERDPDHGRSVLRLCLKNSTIPSSDSSAILNWINYPITADISELILSPNYFV